MQQWKYGYTIRTGERHLRTGAACQDSVFALEDEKCIVMALCDGIGSLSRSGRAAQLAAAAACHILRKCADINFYHHAEVPNGMMKDLLESVDRFVTGKFREEGADHSQGDCTLAFVFVSKLFDFGFAGSLGDSAVCLIRKSGNTCLTESNANLESTASLHIREPWRFAKSETFCLGDDFWGAILTSDGMDGEIYTKNSSQVFRRAQVYFNAAQTDDMKQTLAELAETAVRNSGGELDDDISIAVLSRAEDDVLFPQDVTWLCACGARNRLENSYCFRCGRDFLTLYSSVSFAKYGGKTHFLRYANQHSTLERRFLDGIINQNKLSHKLYPTIERHYTVDNNDKPVGAKVAVRFGKGTRLYAERRNGKRSEPVVLGDMLGDGQGGEGNVYHLTGEFAGEVAKIYKNGQFPTNKFIATREMVQNRRFEEIIWTVFPVGILYADKDFTQPVGIMERYTVTHSSLYDDELFFGDTDNWTRSLLSVRVSDLLYLCKCVTRQICCLNMLGVTVADYNIKNFDYPFSQRDNRYRRSRLDYIQMWDSDSFGYNNYFSGYMADVNRKNYDINKKSDILDLCNDELYSFLFQILTLGDNPYNPVTGRFNYENDSYYQYARKNLVPPSLWKAFESFFTGRSKASPQMMLYLLHEELNRRLRTGETDVTYRELVSRIDAGFFDKAADAVPPVYSPALNFFPQGNRVTPEVNGGDNSHPAETGGTSGQTGTTGTVMGKSEIADSDKNSDLPDKPKRKLGCLTTSVVAIAVMVLIILLLFL